MIEFPIGTFQALCTRVDVRHLTKKKLAKNMLLLRLQAKQMVS